MQEIMSFDWAIKRMLRDKANFEILEGFLSELIAPDKDIKIVKVLESDSSKEVNVLVEIVPGDIVLIGVQFNIELDFLQQMLYGTSKVITEYLAKDDPYAKIKKVYSVNVLYFDLGQGEDYIYKGRTKFEAFIEFIGIHNQERLELPIRQSDLYPRELIRDICPEYYIIKVNNFDDLAKNTLDEWIYFFKNEEMKSEFKAKGLVKAKQALDTFTLSKEERAAYKRYAENNHYRASMIESIYIECKGVGIGIAEARGIAEGRQGTKLAIAKRMLADQEPIEKIIKWTRLSKEKMKEIEALGRP